MMIIFFPRPSRSHNPPPPPPPLRSRVPFQTSPPLPSKDSAILTWMGDHSIIGYPITEQYRKHEQQPMY
jgi:hypothetical protein